MYRFLSYCVLVISTVGLHCTTTKRLTDDANILPAQALNVIGRYATTDGKVELISSAAHVGFSFHGIQCKIFVSLPSNQDHNYLQYEIDGVYQKRLRINRNDSLPITLSALGSGLHQVWIYKATEAHTGGIIIEKITGENVKAVQYPEAPLIEFIGNSITCGAAADASEYPCGTGQYHDQHNAYMSYGARVARALQTKFILSSVSGIGIYRNWNSDAPTMPQVYEKTDFQMQSPRLWDFTSFSPKIVSIALGTNDFSNGDGTNKRAPFDSVNFVSSYVKFVQSIKAKYPGVQIALLSSAMINGEARLLLQRSLLQVKREIDALDPSGRNVAVYFFNSMTPHGCYGHPSVEDHALLANELLPFFKKLL